MGMDCLLSSGKSFKSNASSNDAGQEVVFPFTCEIYYESYRSVTILPVDYPRSIYLPYQFYLYSVRQKAL